MLNFVDGDPVWSIGWDDKGNIVPFSFPLYRTDFRTTYDEPPISARMRRITLLLVPNIKTPSIHWFVQNNVVLAFDRDSALRAIQFIKESIQR